MAENFEEWAAGRYGYPAVNIAQGNAVVGQQVAGSIGVECFAWVVDGDGDLWVLVARHTDGGVYARPRARGVRYDGEGKHLDHIERKWGVQETGPVVWVA